MPLYGCGNSLPTNESDVDRFDIEGPWFDLGILDIRHVSASFNGKQPDKMLGKTGGKPEMDSPPIRREGQV